MSGTVTATQVATADRAVNGATSVQDIVDNPATLSLLTLLVGPLIRQYGHSALAGAIGPVLIIVAAQFGWTMPQSLSESLSVILFVGGSYAWQSFSIWRGKVNAPVQPAPSAP